jgi:hypothetical protein
MVCKKGFNTEDDRGPLRATEVYFGGRTAHSHHSPWCSVVRWFWLFTRLP